MADTKSIDLAPGAVALVIETDDTTDRLTMKLCFNYEDAPQSEDTQLLMAAMLHGMAHLVINDPQVLVDAAAEGFDVDELVTVEEPAAASRYLN